MEVQTPSQKARQSRGRFQGALSLQEVWLAAEAHEAYATPPLTVECWARLDSARERNVLVSHEPRDSSHHWELYSEEATGFFCAHFSWHNPFEVKSEVSIADGHWHYLALHFDGNAARLFVDGREAASGALKRTLDKPRVAGPLTAGVEQAGAPAYDCDGAIEQLRISKGIRPIDGIPAEPLRADADTLSLWAFGEDGGEYADAGVLGRAMRVEEKPTGSLDDIDRASFHAGPGPLDSEATRVTLEAGPAAHADPPPALSLDGEWELAEGGDDATRVAGPWTDAIPAAVPGSVHGALVKAGRLPDPTVGRNDALARAESFKTWWFRTTFARPAGTGHRLTFGGVAVKCTVWLNGERLGDHEGMFGGPAFNLAGKLQDRNTLVVRIDPAPHEIGAGWPNDFFLGMNVGWMRTVVFNNVYGWHYSDIPALGIWRSVRIEAAPTVRMLHPFVATQDAPGGVVDLVVDLEGAPEGWSGTLTATVQPENFAGQAHHFHRAVDSPEAVQRLHLRFAVPDPRLWWPNDLGDPNLYRLKLSFVPGTGRPDHAETTFGIRRVEMAPLPGGPNPSRYNWTFVINSKPVFVKGTGWCTMDPLMDFSRERYDRFLSLADDQHVQMVRAWGSGMPETDDFYDLCDRKGIMVMQEWPTAWNTHEWQPYDLLEETVRLNTLRLRNRPSLVMWGGGNESDKPFGPAIDMMGRYSIEFDGTRPFHRGEPWGGSRHDYTCYWGRAPLDFNLNLTSHFFGEFGLASMPAYESVQRYLPDDERQRWPAPEDGSFAHHTPVFNTKEDYSRLTQYSAYFMPGETMEDYILGSQLAQALGVRHVLERARTRWPHCAGALYYKMNDNYPAASWSCADWYGAPKLLHYFAQDAFAPLHACVLFTTVNTQGKDQSLPLFLLDDAESLRGPWTVVVRAYDSSLKPIKQETFAGDGPAGVVHELGRFTLTAAQTDTTPLLVVAEVLRHGVLADRTFYWLNYEADPGCLRRLPRTRLSLKVNREDAVVTNEGELPAVGAAVLRPGHLDTFSASDNYFWLDPGESKAVRVSDTEGLLAEAWNA